VTRHPATNERSWCLDPRKEALCALVFAFWSLGAPEIPQLEGQSLKPYPGVECLVRDFGSPSDAAVGRDGRLYTAFAGRGELRIVRPDGTSHDVVALGGSAADPFPRRLGWVGDTLWLSDAFAGRIDLFTPGTRRAETRHAYVPARLGDHSRWGIVGILPGWRIAVRTTASVERMAAGQPYFNLPETLHGPMPPPVSSLPIWLTDEAGTVIDTLAIIPAGNRAMALFLAEPSAPGAPAMVRTRMGSQPFADHPLIFIDHSGHHVVVVDRTVEGGDPPPRFFVHRITPWGDTVSSRAYPYDPVPMEDSWVRQEAHRLAESLGGDLEAAVRTARAGIYLPPWLPPVSQVLGDREGWLWLAREVVPDSDSIVWEIHDPEGSRVRFVTLDPALAVRAVQRDTAWVTWTTGTGRFDLCRLPGEVSGSPPRNRGLPGG
jgi:hypothetical protein